MLLQWLLALWFGLMLASSAHADWSDDVTQIQKLVNAGQYAAAEQAATDSLKRGPGSILFPRTGTLTIHHWRSRLRLVQGNPAGAIEDAEIFIKEDASMYPPDIGYALRAVAKALMGDTPGMQADFDAAMQIAKSGMFSSLRTYGVLADRGISRFILNDLAGAKADLTQAIAGEQSAMLMGDYIATRKRAWSVLLSALDRVEAGDMPGAHQLAQSAVDLLLTGKGSVNTSEFVSARLFLDALTRRQVSRPVVRPVDPSIQALLALGPRHASTWGIYPEDAPGGGVRLRDIAEGSAAQAAGLRPGDVLLAVNGVSLRDRQDWLAQQDQWPLYTPLRLMVGREGAEVALTIVVPGRVRMTVAALDPAFSIPGSPATAPQRLSAVEALDAFNVLERIVLDPATGKVAVIGHHDPRFNTGPLPYLDLLKTALQYPTPSLNIKPTDSTAQLLETLRPEITAKLRVFPFGQMVEQVQGHPGLERDRQLLVREMARLFGIAPEEYAAWYNFARLDVQRQGYADLFPPPALQQAIIQAYRTLGYTQAAQALGLIYGQTPQTVAQALGALGEGAQAVAIQSRGGDDILGPLMVAAWLALSEQTATLSPDNRKTLRGYFDAQRMTWQDVVRTVQSVMPYQPKNDRVSLMHQAFNRIALSNPAGLLVFPKLESARSRIEPIDLDPASQLARIMFEADYAFKSIEARPELFAQVPGYQSKTEHRLTNPTAGDAKAGRIWMEPQSVQMSVSATRQVIDMGAVHMAVRAADASNLVAFQPKDADQPDPYMLWTAGHMMNRYDDYASVIPAFHKVREAAKVMALAQWLRAENVRVDLGDVPQTRWESPETFPILSVLSQSAVVWPDGRSQLTTYLSTEGGVSFKPRSGWLVVAPSAQAETRATDQLSLSAGLGQQAVNALGSGDLEKARHLAELSAQAMNGSLSRADLDKQNIVVPEVKGVVAGATQIQLQKEVLRQTSQQIEALKRDPAARTQVEQTVSRLRQVYDDVQAQPASASEHLIRLQTGRANPPPAAPPAVVAPIPASTPLAVAGATQVCSVVLQPHEGVASENRLYLNNKLAQARNRLRYINEALRKLSALNAGQRAQIDALTAELTKAYDAATERAYDFAVGTLTDLPLAKYADRHKVHMGELEELIKRQRQLRTGPMSENARRVVDLDIVQMTRLKTEYETAFSSTERMLALYSGATYGKDIYAWEQGSRDSGDWSRGFEATRLAGKILLDLPWLEDKFLSRQNWFGGNKLWQVVALGKMAGTASDFFWDIMNQYGAWQPLAAELLQGVQFNTQAMNQLRQKAQQTLREIDCLERLVQNK